MHEHHHHDHGHGHSHGLIDPSIKRSRAGLRAVGLSLAVLGLTALAQMAIYVLTGSIALLADLIHNFGDAATAIPLGIAFLLRSDSAERKAGLFVVFAIFASACVAGMEAWRSSAMSRSQFTGALMTPCPRTASLYFDLGFDLVLAADVLPPASG